MSSIRIWLTELDLAQYIDIFETQAIDIDILPQLDNSMLESIGVAALGHRLRILRAIEAMGAAQKRARLDAQAGGRFSGWAEGAGGIGDDLNQSGAGQGAARRALRDGGFQSGGAKRRGPDGPQIAPGPGGMPIPTRGGPTPRDGATNGALHAGGLGGGGAMLDLWRDTARATRRAQEAERRQLTIMFCDLVESTALSTRLDPEDFRDLIRLYHELVSDAATRAGGHVAQFLGDGALVYFGYPLAQEDAAERAVNMGLALIESVAAQRPYPGERLQVRVGLATGLVVVGDIVGKGLDEGAVVSGEIPNLAARLQTAAAPNTMVVSAATRALLGRSFRMSRLDPQALKGFGAPVVAWRVLGDSDIGVRFEARRAAGPLMPLMGRGDELDRLTARWRAAQDGSGGVFMIHGDAGLGKSRLLRELILRTRDGERTLVQFQCSPYFANTALHPIRRMLEHTAGFLPGDGPQDRLDKLIRVLGYDEDEDEDGDGDRGEALTLIAAMLGLPLDRFAPLQISVGLQRRRLTAALISRLIASARRQPVLMVFEDLHWADPTTLEVLGAVAEIAHEHRVLLVETFRPEFQPLWANRPGVDICRIERLDAAAVQGIISHVSGDDPLPADMRAKLADRADGVPLFIEELTKSVMEARKENVVAEDDEHDVPATLLDTLMARLDRLSSPRRIAQIGAVIGREFDEGLLLAVSGQPTGELHDALIHLAKADLIYPAAENGRWVFRHALIRDAAYASLLHRNRRLLHLRIAETLESEFPERAAQAPEFVARHFDGAGAADRAAPQWLLAGQIAWHRGAVKEAQAHLHAGLAQAAAIADARRRDEVELQLQLTLGIVQFAGVSYGAPEAEAAFVRAGELCANVTDPDILAPFLQGYGTLLAMKGDAGAGHEEISKLADLAQDDPLHMIYAASTLIWSCFNRGEFAAAIDWGARMETCLAAHPMDPDGPRRSPGDPIVIGRSFHAAALWSLGYPDQAARRAQAALDYADMLQDPYNKLYAQVNGVCRVADLLGRTEDVLAIATEATDYAAALGYEFASGYSLFWKARALADQGDRTAAAAIIEASLAACGAVGVRYHEPHFRAMQAVNLARRGEGAAAAAALDGLEALVESSGELWQATDIRIARAQVAEAAGDDATAEAAWRDGVAAARAQGARSWELRAATGLAGLLMRRGARDAARATLAPLHGWFAEGRDTRDLKRAAALLAEIG